MLSRDHLKLIPVMIVVLALDIFLWQLSNKPKSTPTVQPNISSFSASKDNPNVPKPPSQVGQAVGGQEQPPPSTTNSNTPNVSTTSNIPSVSTPTPNSVATPPVAIGQINYDVLKQDQDTLSKYLTVEGTLLGIGDNYSIYMSNLNDPETVTINPEKAWIPASTVKAFVALEAYRQHSLGLIDFNTPITITAQNVVPTELETDDFPRLREGTVTTIEQLVDAMIEQSDNTAYNTLLDILDRRNINQTLQNLGLTETVVGEKLNMDDNQLPIDQAVPGYRSNTTTAKDMATMFSLIYNHKVPEAEAMLDIFKKQKVNDMIPALLPSGTVVAHKTGDWAPLYHDGGIVYKPGAPFVLTVFTDGGDPSNIAKLSQVAYFQNPDTVGSPGQIQVPSPSSMNTTSKQISLKTPPDTKVLAASTNSSSDPNASNLGITSQDLIVGAEKATSFNAAILTPGNIFYPIKTWWEGFQLLRASNTGDKVNELLAQSKSRLAEAKSLIGAGKMASVPSLLAQSEQDLTSATKLSDKDPNRDVLLLKTKQTLDLNYAVLNQTQKSLVRADRVKLIDAVYSFYQKEHQDVRPVVQQTVIANPTQQKPTVGTITNIAGGIASVKLDDGTTKDVVIDADAKVRSFQSTTYQPTTSLAVGDKVAVLGKVRNDHKIVPQFIETHLPQDLPKKKQGIVESIDTATNTIQIVDQSGQQEVINLTAQTAVQSTNTQVSIGGIKAGSEIDIYGVTTSPTVTSTTITSKPPSATPAATTAAPTTPVTPATPKQQISVKAVSIRVVVNSSGKNEKETSKNKKTTRTPKKP